MSEGQQVIAADSGQTAPLRHDHGDVPSRSGGEHVRRFIWKFIHRTLWQICWKHPHFLRAGIARLFGANCSLVVQLCASTHIERPWDLTIGKGTTIGPRTRLYNPAGLEIGRLTTISQDVHICGATRDYTQLHLPIVRKKIHIGSHVWVAAGAFIGPGVTIGDGAVIGARSVVMKDVAPWTIVSGSPARFVRKRELRTRDPASQAGAT